MLSPPRFSALVALAVGSVAASVSAQEPSPPAQPPPVTMPTVPVQPPPEQPPPADSTSAVAPAGPVPPALPPAAVDTVAVVEPAAQKPAEKAAEDANGHVDYTRVMGGDYRQINGHNFITPIGLPSAIMNTSVYGATGFGMLTLSQIGPAAVDRSMFGYSLALGGQIDILDRVAIAFDASALAGVSGSLQGLLQVGALTQLVAAATPKVRLFTIDRIGLQMALGCGLEYRKKLTLNPGAAVKAAEAAAVKAGQTGGNPDQAVSDALNAAEDAIIVSADTFDVAPALMIAEGVGPFAIQLAGQPHLVAYTNDQSLLTGDTTQTPPKDHSITSGAQVEFDIAYFTRYFPIAITAQYANEHFFESGSTSNAFTGGLWYSGKRDVTIGAAVAYSSVNQKNPGFPVAYSTIAAQLGIQYFF